MMTLICAGGSGARVLEAVIHLCAAGLGPKELRTFVIDPDGKNGNLDKTKKLIDSYQECYNAFHTGPFFNTKLDLVQGEQGLRTWNPVDQKQSFKNVLNYGNLPPEEQEIVHLLFTDRELNMQMDVGFRGHPALGAAALSLLPLYQNDDTDKFWSQFTTKLKNDVSTGNARVMIAGSVFGGTGASTIHPLVRYLRSNAVLDANKDKLKVGAVALVPYFQYSAHDAIARGEKIDPDEAAKSENFPLASRAAAEYYDHLRQTNDWDFDAMYWIGDDSPIKVDYAKGGSKQDNPAHFVELLGALACLDFFQDVPSSKTCWYAGPQIDTNLPGANILGWDDIPMLSEGTAFNRQKLRQGLHTFHLTACAHLGFFRPLLLDPRLREAGYCVPWYVDRFADGAGNLNSAQNRPLLEALESYFANNYFPWWGQIHSLDHQRVRLLNPEAWSWSGTQVTGIQTNRFLNLEYPDRGVHDLSGVHVLFEKMVALSSDRRLADTGSAPSIYLSMLERASRQVVLERSTASVNG